MYDRHRYSPTPRAWAESLAGQYYPSSADERHARTLHRGTLDHWLTSNPTIFDPAITKSHAYDAAIRQKMQAGKSGKSCFSNWHSRDLDASRRPLRAHLRGDGRRRQLGLLPCRSSPSRHSLIHGEIGPLLTADDNAEEILARFERVGIDVEALDAELQREGANTFVDSWNALMAGLATKSDTLKKAG